MDDMKKGVYLQVLRHLQEDSPLKHEGLCFLLQASLEAGVPLGTLEVFQEFYELNDWKRWVKDGYSIDYSSSSNTAKDFYWWEKGWKDPRIRILNCILNLHES